MRVTNQMITGDSLRNMQKSMGAVNKITNQMTTGKKISKASEDPVVAIRALKLRTTVNQLQQYRDKNIPDARSWFEVTNTSLTNITKRIEDVETYCVQGSTDSFNTEDRGAIIDNLRQIKEMIYCEGNATYAGRYIFSGYKTDKPLTFTETENTSVYSYDIKQSFTAKDFETKNVVLNSVDATKVDSYIANPASYEQPDPDMVYKLQLAYTGISEEDKNGNPVLGITAKDADGNDIDLSAFPITVKKTVDADTYYDVDDAGINVIEATGEIIFGKDAYDVIKTAATIDVDYAKNKFIAGDIRPEHYFGCTQYTTQLDGSPDKVVNYDVPADKQAIFYEVNFNQSLQVNTEGRNIISEKMTGNIDDLINALQDLKDAEDTQKKLKSLLTDKNYASNSAAIDQINKMLSDIDVEVAVRKENMQKTFSNNISIFQGYMDKVSSMVSDVGSRMNKLSMIETRVKEQYASFTELKSQNEDVETDEAIIDFNEAELVYQSALAATGNIMNKTLLDYI